MKIILAIPLFLAVLVSFSQNPTPPCGNDYGSSSDESNIINQMRFGTLQNVLDAISQAKNTRGYSLGCPQSSYSYNTADYTQPSLLEVETIWLNQIKPQIESYTINCPRIGRYENNAALGAYYASIAGYTSDFSVLKSIADMQEAQQYSASNVSNLVNEHIGVYGYIHVGSLNGCYPGGVVGSSVSQICSNIPSFCVYYDLGLFSGENFLIGDQYEPLDFYDGGIAYDHGWIGIQMIEAAIQQTDPVVKGKFKNSAVLAANWAINEHPVKNHNYTAKLIWLLAEMYLWSGEEIYKNALNEKLNRNLIPAVLMDDDNDGFVDGTNPLIAFSDLTQIAQTPGRCWDGHNSLPWYNGMNAWALTEVYCAFRDRGDVQRASELKPIAVAMLDNLSWEINNLGVIDDQLGVRDLTYALLIGIWKIARYENESHNDWETAAWAMWNTGYFNNYSTHSVCVGLYLCILNNTAYQPLFEREDFDSIQTFQFTNRLEIFPNPTNENVTFNFDNFQHDIFTLQLVDFSGKIVASFEVTSSSFSLDTKEYSPGVYVVRLVQKDKSIQFQEKLVIQ